MFLSATDYLLWAASFILLALTCGALMKRKLVSELPVFFIYAAFHVLRAPVLFAVHLLQLRHQMSYTDYFYAYWTGNAISIVLGFTVLYELYSQVFRNYDAIRQLGGALFGCAAVVLLGVAVLAAVCAPGVDTPGIVRAVLLLERSVRLMQCGLLLFLFLLVLYFGLPWRDHVFGIALGFGVFAGIELTGTAVRSRLGIGAASAYSHVGAAAYDCGALIWVCYLLVPQPAPRYGGVLPEHDLDRWNQALVKILQR